MFSMFLSYCLDCKYQVMKRFYLL